MANLALRDRDEQIVLAYESGLTLREIAPRFGISNGRVQQIVKCAGVERRPAARRRPLVMRLGPARAGRSRLDGDMAIRCYEDPAAGDDVCPSCGAFVAELDYRTGWCARCVTNLTPAGQDAAAA